MFRRHWREPHFWRWFWHDRVSFEMKAVVGAVVAALMLGGGWLAADRLARASADAGATGALTFETTVQKFVTVREKGRVIRKSVPVVKQILVGATTAFRTHVITVQGGVRTVRSKVVVHVPVVSKKVVTVNGKTKTVVTTAVTTRLVPTTNIETTTNTLTQVRTQTQIQTQAQTVTTTRTVTQPVTTTQTTTVPVTVTVTVTQPILTVTL